MSDRRYTHAVNFRPGIAGQAKRQALQDSDHLHHSARRRSNADAGLESRRSGVSGKAVARSSPARDCPNSSGELSPISSMHPARGGSLWELSKISGIGVKFLVSADSSSS